MTKRNKILRILWEHPKFKTIFISKGFLDTTFNLPRAEVLIQISSNGGSPTQEAQGIRRILQAKNGEIAKE